LMSDDGHEDHPRCSCSGFEIGLQIRSTRVIDDE
jgi:hypothetical protein